MIENAMIHGHGLLFEWADEYAENLNEMKSDNQSNYNGSWAK